ncbi:eukaryotic translation initiation factor 4E type 2 isoform X2 [Folsomia candida]|uniref:eukaryotic translation initiation factor 4E type 2 isoform X2 n=1 Tax=Folsomia candida TaxID=158441 RepID=UPI000B902BFE|nr:eukaryotic translation initiation factor 4E type 2 isoform X2 [Folsomia candida]
MSVIDDLRKSTAEEDVDDDEDLPPLEVGPSEHKLQYTYGLWYIGKTNYQQYDFSLKKIGRFASVEQFWALYSHLVRPSDLNSPSDFFVFKDGIKPMWEHKGNRDGGQWLVRLNKGLAARCWENLILAILGEQFDLGDEICGAGVSMRQKKDCISLWNKNCADHEITDRIRDSLRKVLNLPAHIQMEYRYHKDFLNWVNQRDSSGREGASGGGGGGGLPTGGGGGGGDSSILPRTPTTPGSSGGGGFSSNKPRSGSPPHFERGENIPAPSASSSTALSREGLGRGAPQINLSSNR